METKTNASEETIKKYFETLNLLHSILLNTKNVSMLRFSENNNISKNLSTVLSKGGIIKNIKKGKYVEWEWTSIKPTREMAIKTIKLLTEENPERKPRGGSRIGSGRKTKKVENTYLKGYTTKYFFGLIKVYTEFNYAVRKN